MKNCILLIILLGIFQTNAMLSEEKIPQQTGFENTSTAQTQPNTTSKTQEESERQKAFLEELEKYVFDPSERKNPAELAAELQGNPETLPLQGDAFGEETAVQTREIVFPHQNPAIFEGFKLPPSCIAISASAEASANPIEKRKSKNSQAKYHQGIEFAPWISPVLSAQKDPEIAPLPTDIPVPANSPETDTKKPWEISPLPGTKKFDQNVPTNAWLYPE